MKQVKYLFLMLFVVMGFDSYSQCRECADPDNVITYLGNGKYTAQSAQAYYWEVENCTGSAIIVGSNKGQNVRVKCLSFGTYKMKLTRFINGECKEACKLGKCGPVKPPCGIKLSGLTDLNILGNGNLVFAANYTLLPNWTITNITFIITYKNNTVQYVPGFVNPNINNVIQTGNLYIDCNNGVKKVELIVNATSSTNQKCSDKSTKYYRIPICGTAFPKTKISVYPNPTNSSFKFEIENDEVYDAKILDSEGNLMYAEKIDKSSVIDVSRYNTGTYFYILKDETGEILKGQIMKL